MAGKGVRYGAEIRKRADSVYRSKTSKYACPKCGKAKVGRISNSQWECKSCGAVLAGGAFSLTTPTGEVCMRMIGDYKKKGR